MFSCDWVEEYKEWLFEFIRIGDRCERYSMLLNLLSCWEFKWSIDHDENRAEDGLMLRERFANEHGCSDRFWVGRLSERCTVLEMMIALSIRCEDIVFDPEEGWRTHCWFWEMISSLGLKDMSDMWFDRKKADGIIKKFLDRKYEIDGNGGLFTVHDYVIDMRKCEIWYQMQSWVMENFEI